MVQMYTGTSDNDVFYGGAGKDMIYGYAGDDLLFGNDGRDELNGANGADTLYGGLGNDNLGGGGGNDRIEGGDGDDVINGGRGSDVLNGGDGADTFVFASAEATPGVFDVIEDFDPVAGDTLDVRVFGAPQVVYDPLNDVTAITFGGSNQGVLVNGLLDLTDLIT
jgi:Ca2+-binding RTX toxin-like protein